MYKVHQNIISFFWTRKVIEPSVIVQVIMTVNGKKQSGLDPAETTVMKFKVTINNMHR